MFLLRVAEIKMDASDQTSLILILKSVPKPSTVRGVRSRMPYLRRLPRLSPTARISVRLTTEQRDLLIASASIPKDVAHALHRAAVAQAKLKVSMGRQDLDSLISGAAKIQSADPDIERTLSALLDYLESLADRFEDPVVDEP
jgi:hypothetical protein